MNYKEIEELLNKRLEISGKIANLLSGITGFVLEASEEELQSRLKEIDKLKAELEALPDVPEVADTRPLGRPKVAESPVSRVVKITLDESDWGVIEDKIKSGVVSGYAEYFRTLHMVNLSVTVYGYDCDCGGRVYEQETVPARVCPHCGETVTRPDDAAIYHMYQLRVNPSTGALDVSDCLIV
jgi:predicted RNA-binding Zn-ribbon protein involved in translation (DUF1610 family)